MMRYGYLGPPGTFTEEALLSLPDAREAETVPYATVPEVVRAVEAGDVEAGIVPIENSIEGSVLPTLDSLATGTPMPCRSAARSCGPSGTRCSRAPA